MDTLFGILQNGSKINSYEITNSKGMSAEFINYGSILRKLHVLDKYGKTRDVVLGYDTLQGYEDNNCFFGCVVGPIANRTKDAKFTLNGKVYTMDQNDGNNNLHTHMDLALHKCIWICESYQKNAVTFSYHLADGELNIPGNRDFKIKYSITDENELRIEYEVISDRETILNLTNHSYFNLNGHNAGSVGEHLLMVKASRFTPLVMGGIPSGEICNVDKSPMDYREKHSLKETWDLDMEQIKIANGFDHNYEIDKNSDQIEQFAILESKESGISMECFTDLPGVQVYTANFVNGECGKADAIYNRRDAICLETQYFPNSINQTGFSNIIFGPSRKYQSTTIYQFKNI